MASMPVAARPLLRNSRREVRMVLRADSARKPWPAKREGPGSGGLNLRVADRFHAAGVHRLANGAAGQGGELMGSQVRRRVRVDLADPGREPGKEPQPDLLVHATVREQAEHAVGMKDARAGPAEAGAAREQPEHGGMRERPGETSRPAGDGRPPWFT